MDEIVGVSLATSVVHQSLNLLVIHIVKLKAVGDVLTDAAREQHGLLLHDGDLVVVPLRVQLLDVASVEQNLSPSGVVEALNQ